MRFDLKTPCTNCPFRTDAARITFAAGERAEEIEEQAYRNGFPCHVSAKLEENPRTGEEGYVALEHTQHCAGYILMRLNEAPDSPWPGINNNEDLLDKLANTMDRTSPVFDSTDEFLDANRGMDLLE